MELTLTVILSVLLSGVTAAIISVAMNKWSEKETRLFKVKLEAYQEFGVHIQSRFTTLVNTKENLYLPTLFEAGSKCLLVSGSTLSKELKEYLVFISVAYKKCESPDFDVDKESDLFQKIWSESDRIVELMRKDLGFK